MNCTDCRDLFAAHAEHLLKAGAAAEFEQHLALCPDCRGRAAAAAMVCQRLTSRAEAASSVALTAPVMRRIRTSTAPAGRVAPLWRWAQGWLGVGAAAAVAAGLALAFLLAPRESKAQPADVLQRGVDASAQLTTVHLKGRLRAPPGENFSYINAQSDFTSVELWKEVGGQKRWRVDKPGRIAWMNGQSTAQFLPSAKLALRAQVTARSAFDTDWLHSIADIEETLANALKMAQSQGWKLELTRTTDAAGAVHQLVTIDVPAAVPAGDYLHNKFFRTAETRRLYQFNDRSGQLEALRIFMHEKTDYLLVFEVTQIDYNQPIADSVFAPELPADVTWSELPSRNAPPIPPPDPKYLSLSAEQAARTFFEACAREDWTEVQVFLTSPLTEPRRAGFRSVKGVVSIGLSFKSAGSTTVFVPYEIVMAKGTTRKHNLALKQDPRNGRWYFDGGF